MNKHTRHATASNRRYQRRIGNILMQDLGYDGAIDICVRNGWSTALEIVKFNAGRTQIS